MRVEWRDTTLPFASTPVQRNENINLNKYLVSSSEDRTHNHPRFTATNGLYQYYQGIFTFVCHLVNSYEGVNFIHRLSRMSSFVLVGFLLEHLHMRTQIVVWLHTICSYCILFAFQICSLKYKKFNISLYNKASIARYVRYTYFYYVML